METPIFLYNPDQNFACRDCTARCCKNWTVDITAADVSRFRNEEWIQTRLRETGTTFPRLSDDHFLLPVIEVDREMRCAFLEPDGRCGMHSRYGHQFLASSCQTFPFDFIEDENEKIVVVTSRVCPSIRENCGDPLDTMLAEKFVQSGGIAKKQTPFLLLGQKTKITTRQYAAVFEKWQKLIAMEETLPLALALCHRMLESLATRWAERTEVDDAEFATGLEEAEEGLNSLRAQAKAELIAEEGGNHGVKNVMLAMACLPLTYPFRSRVLFQGLARGRFLVGVFNSMVSLLKLKGTIDAIYLGREISLNPGLRQEKVLSENEMAGMRAYLIEVLARRKFAMDPRTLSEILFTLIMVPSSYAFFAKLSAAGKNEILPGPADFREAISALEMSILHFRGFMGSSRLFQYVLPLILANPKTVCRLLAGESSIIGTSKQ